MQITISVLASAFRRRCSLKYQRILLFFGAKRDTARASSCQPWTKTNAPVFRASAPPEEQVDGDRAQDVEEAEAAAAAAVEDDDADSDMLWCCAWAWDEPLELPLGGSAAAEDETFFYQKKKSGN